MAAEYPGYLRIQSTCPHCGKVVSALWNQAEKKAHHWVWDGPNKQDLHEWDENIDLDSPAGDA